MFEPYLRQPSKSYPDVRPSLEDDLLNPDESQVYEKIWGVEQNKSVFYHSDLGPKNSSMPFIDLDVIPKKKRKCGSSDCLNSHCEKITHLGEALNIVRDGGRRQ